MPDVSPIAPALGAIVSDINLAGVNSPEEIAELKSLLLQYQVLIIPEQRLEPDDHLRLARMFGDVSIGHEFIPRLSDEHPEIAVFRSADRARADHWHADATFLKNPPAISVLYVLECPSLGGDTMWANQYLALASLSPPLREFLSTLNIVHNARLYGIEGLQAVHPVIRVHPDTGSASLFVSPAFASHFRELSTSEGAGLMAFLKDWCSAPEFQVRHRWSSRTVAIWDNRCTVHYALYDFSGSRTTHRVTVNCPEELTSPTRWPKHREVGRAEWNLLRGRFRRMNDAVSPQMTPGNERATTSEH